MSFVWRFEPNFAEETALLVDLTRKEFASRPRSKESLRGRA